MQNSSTAIRTNQQDPSVRAMVLTGSGTKAFAAGADISEFSDYNSKQGFELSRKGQESLFNLIENGNKPVIAAINGYALGGGSELAMSCHVRIVTKMAKMGLPEAALGLIPGYGGTQRLPQLVGKGVALEMMMSGKMINGEKAFTLGLANYVQDEHRLLPFAVKLGKDMAANSPNAISKIIQAVNAGYISQEGFETEMNLFGECFDSPEFKEGVTAFFEKRKPEF